MSSVMLFLNISNICYNIYVSKRAGAQGIGMFHLVMSVYSLAVTFSVSGIGLTATRLISDMPLSLASKCADSVVKKCIKLISVPAGIMACIIFCGSDFIAKYFLGNIECAICLKFLAATLLFTAFSSVTTGYFTAFGKVSAISFGKFVSETLVWLSTLYFLKVFPKDKTYMAVVSALCIGVVSESLCLVILWRHSSNPLYCKNGTDYKAILRLCTPIAIGSYLRTGLASAENLLIPVMLASFGVLNPVAQYGVIKGMTLPILMFPYVFTGAFTSLIVPEIARRRSLGYKNGIKYISGLSVEYILKFGILVSGIFFKWHNFLGDRFFGMPDAGKYLGFLFVFPVFYFCDSVVDSVLKGMDEQVTSLKINVVDSICRVICTVVFIPMFGMAAYIGIMYLSEIINLGFSYKKLKSTTNLKFPLKKGVVLPFFAICIALGILNFVSVGNPWGDMCLLAIIYIMVQCICARLIR